MIEDPDLAVAARFPFGRYAATPWFRSRREHVGNAEWPPSPWRLARALVASAYGIGDLGLAQQTVALVRHLATAWPRYLLPPMGELFYTQWMPSLAFDDSPEATDRTDNGHTLLNIAPERRLAIVWPGLPLDVDERALLGRLLENVRYLGQSVSVCELTLLEQAPQRAPDEAEARPAAFEGEEAGLAAVERRGISLLAPEPEVTLDQLEVSTADGLLKAMPAPPGSRWVDYVVETPRRATRAARARVRAVTYRLEGSLRPPVPGPLHPVPCSRREGPTAEEMLRRAWGRSPALEAVRLLDDDKDGRAERLLVTLTEPRPTDEVRWLLDPTAPLAGPEIECALRLERVDWAGDRSPRTPQSATTRLLCLRLTSERRPLLADAIIVAEAFRRRLLGVAGRRFGAERIPPALSGRGLDGRPLEDDHAHAHFLSVASGGREIDLLAAWCPSGLTDEEARAVVGTTLPALCGARIALQRTHDERLIGPARVWRSHTPFLPVRHPKWRGGRLVPSAEEQVSGELERRGFPAPTQIDPVLGAWEAFRIVRQAKSGCFPALGAYGVTVEFGEDVTGPICLGRNSHFGMGLFLPARR